MTIDGGIVRKAVAFPPIGGREGCIAVKGIWSGGAWTPGDDFIIQQYRKDAERSSLAVWTLVGVDRMGGASSDTVLILKCLDGKAEVRDGDILVFGDGTYIRLLIESSNLPVSSDISVEVGPNKYHGIAVTENQHVRELIVFHERNATLPRNTELSVLWRDKEYFAQIQVGVLDQGNFHLELYLNGKDVTLNRLISTLIPVRGFVLDAGQELMFSKPSPGGTRLSATYATFEPTVTVQSGSVRILLHPKQPQQVPLFVSPDQPLRIMLDILSAASQGDISQVVGLVSERFFSIDSLLRRLIVFAKEAARHGDVILRAPNEHDITINKDTANILSASLEQLEERIVERTGLLTALELNRSWCRVGCVYEEKQEEWTLSFPDELRFQMTGHVVPRTVSVQFSTRAPEGIARGRGILIDIHNER